MASNLGMTVSITHHIICMNHHASSFLTHVHPSSFYLSGKPGSTFWLCFPYRPDHAAASLSCRQSTDLDRANSDSSFESLASLLPDSPSFSALPTPKSRTMAMSFDHAVDGLLPPILVPDASPSCKKDTMAAKRILLVDDSPPILRIVGRLLETNRFIVETATNGSQSLEKLKKGYLSGKYDMLLTDVQMPIMDGVECTKRFRAWETEERRKQEALAQEGTELSTRPRFLIIGFSANSDTDTKNESLAAGMDYFIGKPFNFIEFQALLASHWNIPVPTPKSRSPAMSIKKAADGLPQPILPPIDN